MQQTGKAAGTNRALTTMAMVALWLAGAAGVRAAEPAVPPAQQPGFAYERFIDTELRVLYESGSAPAIGPMNPNRGLPALRFTGMLTPPADGEYVVRAEADTGVRVMLDSARD